MSEPDQQARRNLLEAAKQAGLDALPSDPETDLRLIDAAKAGDFGGVRAALSEGADVNALDRRGFTALERAVMNDHGIVATYLLDHGADSSVGGEYALCWAAENGAEEVVRLLLARGADAKATWERPLRQAAGNRHAGTVRLLLQAGASFERLDSAVQRDIKALLGDAPPSSE